MSSSQIKPSFARSEHPLVLIAYTLAALLTSFPLVTQFGTYIAGVDGDVWSYLWATGWARASVFLGANPFHTDYAFYPLGGATQLLWATALPSFASLPIQLAFGLVPAFNFMYLAASVLTGYGTYLLCKYEMRNAEFGIRNSKLDNHKYKLAAFVAGLAFAFCSLRLGYGLAFTNLFHTEFIPFYVLCLLKTSRTRGWKNALWAGLFFGLNAYVDFQIAAFLLLLTILWIGFVVTRSIVRDPKGFRRFKNPSGLAARWLAMFATATLVALPMLVVVLNDFAVEGGNYIRVYPLKYSAERSYDALAYFLPNARSTLYQNLPAPRIENVNASLHTSDESEMSPDRQTFFGITLFVLALLGAIRFTRRMMFWIIAAIVFAALSLGPILHLAGSATEIPLPFTLINSVPFLNNIRIPMRYGLMVFFSMSLLAGAGALILLRWRVWMFIPIVVLLLAESIVLPYPTLEFHVPRVYEKIARAQDDATVLEIPSFHWRHAARNQAYQAIHEKRILRAYTNRIAPDLADYFNLRQTPIVVRSLRILEGAEQGILTPEEIAQDRAALQDTRAFFNLRYAILHRDQLDAARANAIDQYVREVMQGRVIENDGATTAYEFPQTAFTADVRALDLASNANLMYLGRGWQMEPLADAEGSQGRYAKDARAQVYVPQSGAAELNLDLYSAPTDAVMQAQVNESSVTRMPLQQGWQTYALSTTLPRRLNLLNLVFNAEVAKQFAIGAVEQR